jgi:hypothetical protein
MERSKQMTTKTFAILAHNGYRYEFVREIQAASVKEAREWFKRMYEGDYRALDFRVSHVDRPSE